LDLAYGLVCLRFDRTAEFRRLYKKVQNEHPKIWLTYQLIGWQDFRSDNFTSGVDNLEKMLKNIPDLIEESDAPFIEQAVEMSGALGNFGRSVAESRLTTAQTKNLTDIAFNKNSKLEEWFRTGIDSVQEKHELLQQQIEVAPNENARKLLQRQRTALISYAAMDYELIAKYLRKRANE